MPKYLIIRFSSIGDIVLTTPVIRCLKKQTGAEVHFLTKKSFHSILDANPFVDKIFTIENGVSEVLPQLQREDYDAVIDLHHNFRSLLVKWRLMKKSYSFDKINLEKWMMVRFKFNRLPFVHIVDRYMVAVSRLGVKNDGEGLDYFLPEADEIFEKRLSEKLPAFDISKSFITFAIGAAHQTKRIPKEKAVEICKNLLVPVALLGGSAEAEDGAFIAANSGHHVLNTCGFLSLHESAFLVKKSWKVITPDTGMMHIAAAFRKHIISIWGNTIPEFGMYPYFPKGINLNVTVEVKNLNCRPCSKIGFDRCPKGHFKCMNDLRADRIIHLTENG